MFVATPLIPRAVASVAVHRLAVADYEIATRLSHVAAQVVDVSLDYHQYWLADFTMSALGYCDSLGGAWIELVAWVVRNTH